MKKMISRSLRGVWLILGGLALILGACRPSQEAPSGNSAPAAKGSQQAPRPTRKVAVLLTPAVASTPQPEPHTGDKLTTDGIHMHRGEPGVVKISWTTESEQNSFGFNIIRARTPLDQGVKINKNPILGAGISTTRQSYVFYDTDVKIGERWYYHAQQLDLDGTEREYKDWTARIIVNRLNLDKITTSALAQTDGKTSATKK